MYDYPVLEQDRFSATVSTQKLPTHRWRACIRLQEDHSANGALMHASETLRVPNDYASEALAVQAAYAYARERIAHLLETE